MPSFLRECGRGESLCYDVTASTTIEEQTRNLDIASFRPHGAGKNTREDPPRSHRAAVQQEFDLPGLALLNYGHERRCFFGRPQHNYGSLTRPSVVVRWHADEFLPTHALGRRRKRLGQHRLFILAMRYW